ncbi:MAG: phage holin family protein [Deltaproteobacteria bacterium]|nr:phage holin family protein [Deltaproteobacteria bacterium]
MFEKFNAAGNASGPGVLHALKAALAALSAILHTRLELFATELEEERERLKQTLILTLLLFFGLSFGFILLTIFIVALFWDKGWIAAIGILSAVYLGVGAMAGLKLRSAFLTRPGLFPATLGELGKDRDHLRTTSRE